MDNVNRTIISQYANDPVTLSLIADWNDALEVQFDIEQFFYHVFDLRTATGYGLDVWGRRAGVSRHLTVAGDPFFGFEQDDDEEGFGIAPFYRRGAGLLNDYELDDDTFRKLIIAKLDFNVSDNSIPSMNARLTALFEGRGAIYVQDMRDMTMNVVVTFAVQQFEVAMIRLALPPPTGVFLRVLYADAPYVPSTDTGAGLDEFYLDVDSLT